MVAVVQDAGPVAMSVSVYDEGLGYDNNRNNDNNDNNNDNDNNKTNTESQTSQFDISSSTQPKNSSVRRKTQGNVRPYNPFDGPASIISVKPI